MAIAIDSAGSVQSQGAAASLTFAHTCAGANRWLAVCIGLVGPVNTSEVTYNGVNMTRLIRQQNPAAADGQSEIWGLINPATGANNVVVTWDFALDGSKLAQAISFTGIDQQTAATNGVGDGAGSTGSLDGTSSSLDVTSSAGDLVLDCMVLGTSSAEAPTAAVGQTERGTGGAAGLFMATSTKPGVTTTNMSWTWTTDTCRRQTGVSIQQLVEGGVKNARFTPIKRYL